MGSHRRTIPDSNFEESEQKPLTASAETNNLCQNAVTMSFRVFPIGLQGDVARASSWEKSLHAAAETPLA